MPSGNIDKPVIEDNHDGTVSLKYDPREEGLHEVAVKFNGEHIPGKFFANFYSLNFLQFLIFLSFHFFIIFNLY